MDLDMMMETFTHVHGCTLMLLSKSRISMETRWVSIGIRWIHGNKMDLNENKMDPWKLKDFHGNKMDFCRNKIDFQGN